MKAECTWGEGPDIILSLNNTAMVLYENPCDLDKWKHGVVKQGSLDLTAFEAHKLAMELLAAVNKVNELEQMCNELEQMCEKHDKHEEA